MTTTWRARYVLPMDGPPIEGGAVTFSGDRIVSVEAAREGEDLGDALILPGLVNAHAHLEFSDLAEPLGHAGIPLPEWIRSVVARRRESLDNDNPHERARTIRSGLDESLRHGTTCVGEIATDPCGSAFADYPGLATVFLEVLGHADNRIADAARRIDEHLARPGSWTPGASPHAPYSVHPELLERVVAASRAARAPVAMHVAESAEELELLATGGGPFRALLEDLGAWPTGVFPLRGGVDAVLSQLVTAERALVVHGNYLSDGQVEWLAKHRDRVSVVFCPRTWRYFGHRRHPVEALRAAGVNVAVGTDSRASNPDLDLLAELRALAAWFPAIEPRAIVDMGTIGGARALGQPAGVLRPAGRADLVVIRAPLAGGDAYAAVVHPEARVERVVCGGQRVR